MKSYITSAIRYAAVLGGATAFVSPALVWAQVAQSILNPNVAKSGDADHGDTPEIIVTGTLIRGVAPPGTNVLGVSQKDVQATGATTTAQLLQTIPQLGQFNSLQQPAGAFNNVTTNRPNLRNLPGFQTSGGSSTLVLVDGHRVVGSGIQSTSPDPDIVPPGVIERVEIVPDGGSAVYGSDAVAGVINFITRKSFDGLQVDGHYGFADNYHNADANATAGKDWGSGSAYISYNYSEHGALYGRDLDFVRMYPKTLAGVPFPVTSLRCNPGNVQNVLTGGTVYALPFTTGNAVANTANQCDESDAAPIYPSERRHSLFAGLSQDLTSAIKLDVRAFYTNRKVWSDLGPNVDSEYIGPSFIPGLISSPYQSAHFTNPASPFEVQQVSYAFGDQSQHLRLSTWGIAPTVTADLGHGWQLRSVSTYGESTTVNHVGQYNQTGIQNAIMAGAFNPYDVGSSTPEGLEAAGDWETYGRTHQSQFNTRLILDGSLLTLPGGDVKLAAGAEYDRETFQSQKGTLVPGTQNSGYGGLVVDGNVLVAPYDPLPVNNLSRNVKSVFGELVVPIFGKDNGFAGMRQLTVSAAGRYDSYSDVGGTFNPKFGLTYRPVEWVKLRAAWGKSFEAPSLADNAKADLTTFNEVSGLAFLLPPAALVAAGKYPDPMGNDRVAVVLGSAPGIQPQKATTWSLGMDVQPPFVPGLSLSLTYFNINFKGVIQIPNFTNQVDFYTNFGSVIITHPTQEQIDSFIAQSNSVVGSGCAVAANCYAILDARKRNFSNFKLDGLDIGASYTLPTSFGSLDFAANANYELDRKIQATDVSPVSDLLAANNSRFKMSTTVGAQVGKLLAQVTWNHSGGYALDPGVGIEPLQYKVSSYDVINLFFKYDFKGEGAFKDLALTLNVNNIADQDPPIYRQQSITPASDGYINGSTVGRLIQFGINKKF